MEKNDQLAEELERILPGRVVKDVSVYQKDWWSLLTFDPEAQGQAAIGVKPSSIDELVALVNFASSNHVALYLRGGGSSVTGASLASAGGVVVDLTAMNQVLDIDEANKTATIQAGARLKDIEAKLNRKGFTFSQFPQSLDIATLGGYISTFGTGQYSTLLGGVEDSILRLEVVLPTGEVIWTKKRGSPRSSVGPDLARLFIGAEGAFGIVSAAEVKIRKISKHVWKAAYSFGSFQTAISAARSLMDLDVRPAVCRAYNELESTFQFELQQQQDSCIMLVVYDFQTESVFKAMREEVSTILEQSSTVAEPELVDKWLEKRFNYRDEIEAVKKLGYTVETIEVGAKWTRLYELYVDAVRSLEEVKGIAGVGAHVSHLYDQGACIYFTVLFQPDRDVYWRLWEVMGKVSKNHDATVSHHHGVGILKKVYAKDEIPTKVLHKIKQAIDPNEILNPGRLP